MANTQFLRNPAEIRKAVRRLQGGRRLDLAVAFVGADWSELLADHQGNAGLGRRSTHRHAVHSQYRGDDANRQTSGPPCGKHTQGIALDQTTLTAS